MLFLLLFLIFDFANALSIPVGTQSITYTSARSGVCTDTLGPRMFAGSTGDNNGPTKIERCGEWCLKRKLPLQANGMDVWINLDDTTTPRVLPFKDLRGFSVDLTGRCYCELETVVGPDMCTTVYEGSYQSYAFECPLWYYLDDGGGTISVNSECKVCPRGKEGELFTYAYPLEQCSDINECQITAVSSTGGSFPTNPCYNGGICSDSTTDPTIALGEIECACPSGYDGKNCQNTKCGSGGLQACQNGGICFDKCYCPSEYEGERCEREKGMGFSTAQGVCDPGESYKGSTLVPQKVPGHQNGKIAEYCYNSDYSDQYRPYDGASDNPGTTHAEKLLHCFRACIDFDGAGTSIGPNDAYTDKNYFQNHEWWQTVHVLMNLAGRCYCYSSSLEVVDHKCVDPLSTYLLETTYQGYNVIHKCESCYTPVNVQPSAGNFFVALLGLNDGNDDYQDLYGYPSTADRLISLCHDMCTGSGSRYNPTIPLDKFGGFWDGGDFTGDYSRITHFAVKTTGNDGRCTCFEDNSEDSVTTSTAGYENFDIDFTGACQPPPKFPVLKLGSGRDRPMCDTCERSLDCASSLTCGQPKTGYGSGSLDYNFAKGRQCLPDTVQDSQNRYCGTGAVNPYPDLGLERDPSLTRDEMFRKCSNACLQSGYVGFTIGAPQPGETNIPAGDTFDNCGCRPYGIGDCPTSISSYSTGDGVYYEMHEYTSVGLGFDPSWVSAVATTVDECADACRDVAKGFVFNNVQQNCWCDANDSGRDDVCDVSSRPNSAYRRYDFNAFWDADYVWAHNGECDGSELYIGIGYSIAECADACRGTAKGFLYRRPDYGWDGKCYCEYVYSHPHADCPTKNHETVWNRYDFIPEYAFMHYGECRGGPGISNSETQINRGTGHSLDECAILCKDYTWNNNGPKTSIGFIYSEGGDACYCEALYSHPHPDCAKATDTGAWARYDYVNYSPVIEFKQDSRCMDLTDSTQPTMTSLTGTDEEKAVQCGRVCQGAVVQNFGATGFVVSGTICRCESLPSDSLECVEVSGWKRYDFRIAAGGVYQTFGYCHPGPPAHELFPSGQFSGTVDDWLENCRAGCVSHTPTASHFNFNPSDGHCYCMQTGGGAHTEHPCETGSITLTATSGWYVYTIWDGGVTDVPGCANAGQDVRGLGVCVLDCIASDDPFKDGSDGEFYCINGVISGVIGSCGCLCAPGFSGTNCEVNINECAPIPCQHGGVCSDGIASYSCACADGYSGENCEIADACVGTEAATTTAGEIHCVSSTGSVSGTTGNCLCTCNAGYEGAGCATPKQCVAVGAATTTPGEIHCVSTGYAYGDTSTGCFCQCDTGYTGAGCGTADDCFATEDAADLGSDGYFWCINNGIATGTTGNCGCTCQNGFSGAHCHECAPGSGYIYDDFIAAPTCVICAVGSVNNQVSHTAACSPLGCAEGYGHTSDIDDGTFTFTWDPDDTSPNSGNCRRCPPGTESLANDGQCVSCNAGYEGMDCLTPMTCTASQTEPAPVAQVFCLSNRGYVSGTFSGIYGDPFQSGCVCNCYTGYVGAASYGCGIALTCVDTSNTGDNGSNGNFYCEDTGSVSGTTGNCLCTCNAGYEGAGCATPKQCVGTEAATTTAGEIHCVSSTGSVSGTTGNCLCTCIAGYEGAGCATPKQCVGTEAATTTAGEIHCVSSTGSVSGTTGNCLCTCNAGYEGAGCATPKQCVGTEAATTTAGEIHCVSSTGSVSGTTGNCLCTCIAGYEGAGCATPKQCVGTEAATTTAGEIHCVSSTGSVSGTTGNCLCTCIAGYEGAGCATPKQCVGTEAATTTAGEIHCVSSTGSVSGTTGNCLCTCNAGYEGAGCATPKQCEARDNPCPSSYPHLEKFSTTDFYQCYTTSGNGLPACKMTSSGIAPPDDGSWGSSGLDQTLCVLDHYTHCLSTGSVSGTTGNCLCTCDAGYEGPGCATALACTDSSDALKDGTDGEFYCVNGGIIGGTTGACTCTNCNAGYSGTNCQTADVCTLSSNNLKDGTDGEFYCVNGGVVGGTTGSCTCTNCNAGWGGLNCYTPLLCTGSSDPSKDGTDGEFYCVNGGIISGVTMYCLCTGCNAGYRGKSCEIEINECEAWWDKVGNGIAGPANDNHGRNVIMNYDGSVVAFGTRWGQSAAAPDDDGEGFIGIYQLIGTTWTQMGSNVDGEDENDDFGSCIAISDDGFTVAAGAPYDGYGDPGCGDGCGRVRIFTYDESTNMWNQKGQNLNGAADEYGGSSVALSSDGSRVAVGLDSGVEVYEYVNLEWQLLDSISGAAHSIQISGLGNIVVIGSPYNSDAGTNAGHVRVFEYENSVFNQKGLTLTGQAADDNFGFDVCMNNDGSVIAVGAPGHDQTLDGIVQGNEGTVQVFAWSGSAWVQRGQDLNGYKTIDSTDHGNAISLSDDGLTLSVGAPHFDANPSLSQYDNGMVKMYKFDGTRWKDLGDEIIGALDYQLGVGVALSGDGKRVTVGTLYMNEVNVYEISGVTDPCLNGGVCTDLVNDYSCACINQFSGKDCDECAPGLGWEAAGLQATFAVTYGFSQIVACEGMPVNVVWTGSHNIQETESADCLSANIGPPVVDFHSSGYSQTFSINELSAAPGQTRYFKCDTHCGPSAARFEVSCPAPSCVNCAVGSVNNQVSHLAECAPLGCAEGYGHTSDITTDAFTDLLENWDGTDPSPNSGNCLRCPADTESPANDGQCASCSDPGMGGLDCLTDIDECAANEGFGACDLTGTATCDDSTSDNSIALDSYVCTCAAGYENTNCDTDTDECAPNEVGNCLNGATCADSTDGTGIPVDTYVCTCAAGWEDTNCETPSACAATATPSDVGSDGNYYCLSTGSVSGTTGNCLCTCNAGYEGAGCATASTCEARDNPCPSSYQYLQKYSGTSLYWCYENSDQSGGACRMLSSGIAPPADGTWGTGQSDCVLDHYTHCEDTGSVSGTTGNCLCTCNAGYEGDGCATDIDDCDVSPCINSGACNDLVNDYNCACINGFSGKSCDECAAGSGFDGSACVPCENTQANNLITHDAVCANQTCSAGFGVVTDGFDFNLDPFDTTTANCVALYGD